MRTVELGAEDAAELTALYEAYGWWADRSRTDVESALDHSLVLGLRDDGRLVASARVLTDRTYYARIYDVVVATDRRDEGIGRDLLAAVVEHPALADCDPVLLCRAGLVEFYERCGFEPYPDSVEIPEGGREELRTMRYSREG